jgi:hypothetical protein
LLGQTPRRVAIIKLNHQLVLCLCQLPRHHHLSRGCKIASAYMTRHMLTSLILMNWQFGLILIQVTSIYGHSQLCAPPKRRRRISESLSDADESRLGQYIEAFKKIHRSDNRARAGIGELVHLAARSRGKHRLRDSLCKAIDSDDVLLS